MARKKKRKNSRGKKEQKLWNQILAFAAAAAAVAFILYLQHGEPLPRRHKHQAAARPKLKVTGIRQIPARKLTAAPKIVFVIDDIGNTNLYTEELEALGNNVTYSILPLLRHTDFFDRFSLQTGAEVILHLPLESEKGTIPGPGLITTSMPDSFVLDELRRNLNSVPHAVGSNNHMGSKGTADPRLMNLILRELKSRQLFFLDSKTTAHSVGQAVANRYQLRYLSRDEFLDNEDSIPAIRNEIAALAEKARWHGYAIGIGHYRPNTLEVLAEEIPRLKRAGFQIVSLTDILGWKK